MPVLTHPEPSLQVGRETWSPRTKPREPGGRKSQQGAHKRGESRRLEPGLHLLATLWAALNDHGSHVLFVFCSAGFRGGSAEHPIGRSA